MPERNSKWIEFEVAADAESVEAITELFGRYGHNQGVVVEEPYRQDEDGENFEIDPLRPVIVRTFVPDDDRAGEARIALQEGLWHLRQIGAIGELSETQRVEDDWADTWKQYFHVLRIGRRFVVQPTWCEYDPLPDDLVIHIDPGMAFGTGSHPSTEMCLQLLETVDISGKRVLDAGAGSGILSVASVLAGAVTVDSIEIDPYAVKALDANVELNAMTERIQSYVGPVGSIIPDGQSYDLVTANIIARILVENVEQLTGCVVAGGEIIASGIIAEREHDVVEAYHRYGFDVRARRQSGDWLAILFRDARDE